MACACAAAFAAAAAPRAAKSLLADIAPPALAIAIAVGLSFSPVSQAQETTAEVRGIVADGAGTPIEGATVTVTSRSTGISKTVEASATGSYSVRGLPAGVIYDVEVVATGLQKSTTSNVSLAVGQSAVLNYNLSAVDEIVVTAEQIVLAETAIGPNAIFDVTALQDSPSVNRNINDIIQQDPRLYVDQLSLIHI